MFKVKKQFEYRGHTLRIVERDEAYMNAPVPVRMTRVLAPNWGIIPVQINRRQTLKSIQADTAALLDSFENRGADIHQELTKDITTHKCLSCGYEQVIKEERTQCPNKCQNWITPGVDVIVEAHDGLNEFAGWVSGFRNSLIQVTDQEDNTFEVKFQYVKFE